MNTPVHTRVFLDTESRTMVELTTITEFDSVRGTHFAREVAYISHRVNPSAVWGPPTECREVRQH